MRIFMRKKIQISGGMTLNEKKYQSQAIIFSGVEDSMLMSSWCAIDWCRYAEKVLNLDLVMDKTMSLGDQVKEISK